MALDYTKTVMEHFMHPKNLGEMKDADGIGKVGNITCGDIMWLFIKVGKKKVKGKEVEFIKEIKFKTLGCAAAIATTSMMTVLAKGKTIDEAMKITNDDVIKGLGGLPPVKHHCSLLAEEAIAEALYDFFKKSKREIPKNLMAKHRKAEAVSKVFCKVHG